jgi:hypothetical protein
MLKKILIMAAVAGAVVYAANNVQLAKKFLGPKA